VVLASPETPTSNNSKSFQNVNVHLTQGAMYAR